MSAIATNTPEPLLPSNCYLEPESDDEESFVVLSRSLPPESSIVDYGTEAVESVGTNVIEASLNLTDNALSLSKSAGSFPSIPKMKEQELPTLVIENDVTSTTTNSSVDLSPDEIQGKLDMLIEDNIRLKETLRQNNLAMKKQYATLMAWQEDVMRVHQSHKVKFAQTKKYIENLKLENAKLTDALKVAHAELLKSQTEVLEVIGNKTQKEVSLELEESRQKITDLESQIQSLQQELCAKQQSSLSSQVLCLQKELAKQMSEANDTVAALRAQLEVYKCDFEAERQAKQSIKAEKEQITEDLRNLQRRNHQLMQEVEQLRGNDFVRVNNPGLAMGPPRPREVIPDYSCPKCNFTFLTYQALENHVHRCLDSDF